MRKIISLRQALSDPGFLALALSGESWASWRILLIAAVGEELTESERETTLKALTGRDAEPGVMVEIFEAIVGRRGGKSKAMAVLIVFVATLCDWTAELSFERGLALIVAPSERQAANILRYALGIIEASPLLADLVENKDTGMHHTQARCRHRGSKCKLAARERKYLRRNLHRRRGIPLYGRRQREQ